MLFGAFFPEFIEVEQTLLGRTDHQDPIRNVRGKVAVSLAGDRKNGSGSEKDFAFINILNGSSGIDRILPHSIDLIAEKFDSDGQFHSGRENVDQTTSAGKFADNGRFRLVIVAHFDQFFRQFGKFADIALPQYDFSERKLPFIRNWCQKCVNGSEKDVRRFWRKCRRQHFSAWGFVFGSRISFPDPLGQKRSCQAGFKGMIPDFCFPGELLGFGESRHCDDDFFAGFTEKR